MGFNPIYVQNVVKSGASCAGARGVDWGSNKNTTRDATRVKRASTAQYA